jgi:hypothetical protein
MNRLSDATSPYLLQHAENPVDWWPWSDEAFGQARARNVPVLLSVGYAACHWCHVMAHESFEDPETAALMNDNLVAIKVDREERPDVDAVYMAATQAMTGQGGWPMTVFMTPDGEPFYCGTYFPRETFQRLVLGVAKAWRDDRDGVSGQAGRIAAALTERGAPLHGLAPAADLAALCDQAVATLAADYDHQRGGFGGAPKFPPSMVLEFLLRHSERPGAGQGSEGAGAASGPAAGGLEGDQVAGAASGPAGGGLAGGEVAGAASGPAGGGLAGGGDAGPGSDHAAGGQPDGGQPDGGQVSGGLAYGTALAMVAGTAHAMARGGMYDQIGGGFARYSVDAGWVVPHFEKMLYDNALLARVYAHLWRRTGDPLARRVAQETCAWMIRELRTPEGGFASALDADSEGQEGLFYTWTPAELAAELGEADGRYAAEVFGVTQAGTFEHGRSVLQLRGDPAEPDRFAAVRDALLVARERRVRPGRDDKVVAAWNGLAIAALAECGLLLADPGLTAAATGAADLLTRLHLRGDRLARTSRAGVAGPSAGVLEDYACVAGGLLALSGATGQAGWVKIAGQLLDTALARFSDGGGAFYDTADDGEALIYRPADPIDGPTPSGTFATADALLSYGALTGSARHREAALAGLGPVGPIAARYPRAAGAGLAVAEAVMAGPAEIAVVGPAGDPRTAALHSTAMLAAPPGAVIALGDGAAVGAGPGGVGGERSADGAAGMESGPGGGPGGAGGERSADGAAGMESGPGGGPGGVGGERSADGAAGMESGPGGGPGGASGERSADGAAAGTDDVDSATRAGPAEVVPLLAGRGLVAGAPAAYVCRNFTCRMPVTDPMELRAVLAYPAPAPAG